MKPFRFADEAILYVKHAEVVEEIRKRFATSMRAFFDQVAERLSDREWPCELTYVVNGGSAYFWLSRESQRDPANEPVIWCAWKDPGIVRDNGVMASVAWTKGSSEQKSRVAALVENVALVDCVCKTKPNGWKLFDVWIAWESEDDPVSVTADALDPVLRLLDGARRVPS